MQEAFATTVALKRSILNYQHVPLYQYSVTFLRGEEKRVKKKQNNKKTPSHLKRYFKQFVRVLIELCFFPKAAHRKGKLKQLRKGKEWQFPNHFPLQQSSQLNASWPGREKQRSLRIHLAVGTLLTWRANDTLLKWETSTSAELLSDLHCLPTSQIWGYCPIICTWEKKKDSRVPIPFSCLYCQHQQEQ